MNPVATAGLESEIPPLLVLPFGLLLLLIATMPLSPDRVKHAWEKGYPVIAIGLGLVVAGFYFLKIEDGSHVIAHTLQEYASFIALIGSLFVVAGGIHIKVKGEANPMQNVAFLFVGAVLANLIGTTGASMVLIRPFIRMNKIRISAYHIVFFIFLISNVGGALTPIGDPPLFLGYLQGVPFFWLVERCILPWFVSWRRFMSLIRRRTKKCPASCRSKPTSPRAGNSRAGSMCYFWPLLSERYSCLIAGSYARS